jgi:REP element-mobilizing transposase RayT|tara:strand:- start:902 stop:1453 length:552 start_codon:yes stop_codon:yes gene_type:complete
MKLETLDKDYYYHIYNRGINGDNIFTNDANKVYFLKLYKKYLTTKVATFAYCLLNNHFHFLIRIEEEPKEVIQAFSNLFNAYAKAFNKQQNRTGSLFEKHFKRIRLHNEEYLRKLVFYIHLNPQHHFNDNFENFRFSSYKAIISENKSLIRREEVIGLFSDLENLKYSHRNKSLELEDKFKLE